MFIAPIFCTQPKKLIVTIKFQRQMLLFLFYGMLFVITLRNIGYYVSSRDGA